MATVTELLDRGVQLTGLRSSGTERTLALNALQNAYTRTVMESECYIATASYTFAASTNEYSVSAVCGTTPLKIRNMVMVDGGLSRTLHGTSEDQLIGRLRNDNVATGNTYLYAALGTNNLMFYPKPRVGDVVNVYYVPNVPTLVDATSTTAANSEITPTYVPVQWHYDVLLPALVVEMLDKDQRPQDVQFWQSRYVDGMARMKEWSAHFMGDATPAYIDTGNTGVFYEDQRRR